VLQRLELADHAGSSPWRHSRYEAPWPTALQEMEGSIVHGCAPSKPRRPQARRPPRIRQSYWPASSFSSRVMTFARTS